MNDPLSNFSRHESGGMESPSAYASAESSPSQSMVTSFSMQSFRSNANSNGDAAGTETRSAMTVSQSLNSFSSSVSVSSMSMSKSADATTKVATTHHIDLSAIPSSMSVSGIDALEKLEELNMQAFTSLPPAINSSSSSSSDSSSNSSKQSPETVKERIERTVKSELEKSPKQTTSPSQRAASSVLSVLGRIFKSAASKASPSPPASPIIDEKKSTKSTSLSPSPSMNSNSDLGSSSEQQQHSAKSEKREALSEQNQQTSIERKAELVVHEDISPKEVSSQSTGDSDKELPASSDAQPCSLTEDMNVPASSYDFCMDLNLSIVKNAKPVVTAASSADDHQRFTKNASTSSIHNDLKAILEADTTVQVAVSAAAPKQQPLVDVATTSQSATSGKSSTLKTKKKSTSSHQKKQSRRSSSSAANTSNEAANVSKTTAAAPVTDTTGAETSVNGKDVSTSASVSASPQQATTVPLPKAQRAEKKQLRSKQSKSSEKKEATTASTATAAATAPVETKTNVFELLVKTTLEATAATSKQPQPQPQAVVKLNTYRYTREFLMRIRDERAKLIDNICPDIFRATTTPQQQHQQHAYSCTSDMSPSLPSAGIWDPLSYFNSIEARENNADLKKPYHSNYHRQQYYHRHVQQQPRQHSYHSQYHSNSYYNNNNKYAIRKNQMQYDRSRRTSDSRNNSLLSSLMNSSNNSTNNLVLSDKYLLDLLKKGSTTSSATQLSCTNQGIDLMEILNKKDERRMPPLPSILTAQELEFGQLFSSGGTKLASNCVTPKRHYSSSNAFAAPAQSPRSSPASSSSLSSANSASKLGIASELHSVDNTSDAYKQLVKNLNNHPLSAPKSLPPQHHSIDDLFRSVTAPKTSNEMSQESTTNLLKQLLNLNNDVAVKSLQTTTSVLSSKPQPQQHQQQRHFVGHNNNNGFKSSGSHKPSRNYHYYKAAAAANKPLVEREHFNHILEKLMPTLSSQVGVDSSTQQPGDDIMKWFPNPTQ